MAQYARPDDDISGSWDSTTGANYFDQLNEVSVNDSTYIQEDDGSTLVMGMSDVTDPAVSTGHILRVHCYRSSNKANTFTVRLLQGASTEIWTNSGATVTSGAPSQDYGATLSAGEADSITDYTDLRLEVTATCSNPTDVFCTWAELEVPNAPGGQARRIMVIS